MLASETKLLSVRLPEATFGLCVELTRRWLRSCGALPMAIRFWKLPRSSKSLCNSSLPSFSSRLRMRRLPLLSVSQSSRGRPESSSAQVSVQKTDANLGHQATDYVALINANPALTVYPELRL